MPSGSKKGARNFAKQGGLTAKVKKHKLHQKIRDAKDKQSEKREKRLAESAAAENISRAGLLLHTYCMYVNFE